MDEDNFEIVVELEIGKRLESRRAGNGKFGQRATVLVGPALILTTVVLACGLVVTVFSDLPSLRLFGWLSAFSMIAALVADLFILRPTSMFLINLSQRIRGTSGHAKPAEEGGANG
jgi:predicted RND superfamily exporter protein